MLDGLLSVRNNEGSSAFSGGHKKRHRDIAPLNRLPLLCSQPGGVRQELVASLCRDKGIKKMLISR